MSVIDEAVELIKLSDSILVTAGAGMGVDSGLPDFRGKMGFGRHTRPSENEKSALQRLQIPSPSEITQNWLGASTAIV
jgi:NAD-dependent SIR2 family protein deacetylase